MVKFTNFLKNYQGILSFDLAKNKTGFSLYDFDRKTVLNLGLIDTEKVPEEKKYAHLYSVFRQIIQETKDFNLPFFITKERLPNQAGPRSTIATLQELAKVHAIFDLAVCHEGVETYDCDGIHSISVKSYFKKITNLEKPTKEDIANKIIEIIPNVSFENYSLDVSDSLAVTLTLLNSKWKKDLEEEIKTLKKEKKKYKSEKKLSELDEKISFLESLKEVANG